MPTLKTIVARNPPRALHMLTPHNKKRTELSATRWGIHQYRREKLGGGETVALCFREPRCGEGQPVGRKGRPPNSFTITENPM